MNPDRSQARCGRGSGDSLKEPGSRRPGPQLCGAQVLQMPSGDFSQAGLPSWGWSDEWNRGRPSAPVGRGRRVPGRPEGPS